jgi:hypothetical protein
MTHRLYKNLQNVHEMQRELEGRGCGGGGGNTRGAGKLMIDSMYDRQYKEKPPSGKVTRNAKVREERKLPFTGHNYTCYTVHILSFIRCNNYTFITVK